MNTMTYSVYSDKETDVVIATARKRLSTLDWLRHGVVQELARMVLQERANCKDADQDKRRYRQTICDLSDQISKLKDGARDGTFMAADLYLHHQNEMDALKKRLEDAWAALADLTYGDVNTDKGKQILEVVKLDAKLEALKFVMGCFHHYEQDEVYQEVSQFEKYLKNSKEAIQKDW